MLNYNVLILLIMVLKENANIIYTSHANSGENIFQLNFSRKRGCLIHSVSKAQTQKHYLFKDFDFSKLKAILGFYSLSPSFSRETSKGLQYHQLNLQRQVRGLRRNKQLYFQGTPKVGMPDCVGAGQREVGQDSAPGKAQPQLQIMPQCCLRC